MRESYALMLQHKHDVELKHIAFLHDRIQFFQSRPQCFGTQHNADGTIFRIENKSELNRLRERYNLLPLSQHDIMTIQAFDRIEAIENQEMHSITWRKKTCWKS